MDDEGTQRPKVHAVAGVLWAVLVLGQLVLFGHAAVGGPATFIPWAEAHAAFAPWSMALAGAALVTWLGTGYGLGFRFGTDESLRRLRRLVAPLAGLFALVHGWLVWGRVVFGGHDARALWVASVDTLSHAVPAWAYAFGTAALALWLEQALRMVGEAFAFPRREAARRWYGLAAIVLSAALLFFAYDGLSAIIAGRPLLGGGG